VTHRPRGNRLGVPALVATLCVGAASACAGGVMTAAQMVCCMHDHHECEMAMDGDSCCRGAHDASQQFVHGPTAKFHADVAMVVATCPPAGSMTRLVAALREHVGCAARGQPPGPLVASYLLNSAFLI